MGAPEPALDDFASFGDEELESFFVMSHHEKRQLAGTLLLELLPRRFLGVVGSALALIIVFMVVLIHGIVIIGEVYDHIGSSKNAKDKVEYYQTFLGYLMALLDILRERHFEIFLPVFVTYLANLRWFPRDQPRENMHHVKRIALFWFLPVLGFVLNVGFSSVYVTDKTIGIRRIFLDADLRTVVPRPRVSTNVEDTILRTAVLRRAEPFRLLGESQCKSQLGKGLATKSSSSSSASSRQTDDEGLSEVLSTLTSASVFPTVSQVEQTSVVYGFPLKEWNYDLLPTARPPRRKVNFTLGQYPNNSRSLDQQFTEFQQEANLDFESAYDLLLQGDIMMERSMSMGTTSIYPCHLVDGRGKLDKASKKISTDTEEEEWERDADGTRMCRGAPSTLGAINAKGNHSFEGFLHGLSDLLLIEDPDIYELSFEVIDLSEWVQVTSLTMDWPMGAAGNYSSDAYDDLCGAPNRSGLPPKIVKQLCNDENYVYDLPRSTCGSTNCVFMDFNDTIALSRELLMFPFQSNCSTSHDNLKYDKDYGNWFPSNCNARNNSMFLYGFGTYVTGESFTNGVKDHILPQLVKPRRHAVVTFAKMDWKYDDLSVLFGAKCAVKPNCNGLVHELADTKRYVLVGESFLPGERNDKDFKDPIRLVTLNTKAVDYKNGENLVEWEYIDQKRFKSSDWNKNNSLQGESCSMLLDSYIHHVESNHYYLDEPLQPLYTSAMYYLFQNAAVKHVNSTKKFKKVANETMKKLKMDRSSRVLAVLSLSGDREIKEVSFSIPLASAIASFVGMGLMLVLTLLMLVHPLDALQLPNGPTVARKFIKSMTEEEYPEQVHRRLLRFPNGGEQVDANDYTVERIRFYHVRDVDKKIEL